MSAVETRPETLEERAARLEKRLEDGFTRIGEKLSQGIAVDSWETVWIELLREYVAIEDELAARPRVQVALGLDVRRAEVER